MKTLTKSVMLIAALTITPLSASAFMCGSGGKGYGPGPHMKHGYYPNHMAYDYPRWIPGRHHGYRQGYGHPGYARPGNYGMYANNQYAPASPQTDYYGQQAYATTAYANTSNSSSTEQPGTQAVSGTSVAIKNMQFQPATIKVKSGESVTWINSSAMPHTVTSTDGGKIASQTLGNGGAFQHTFTEPGTYTYICSLHPSMTGTVIVE